MKTGNIIKTMRETAQGVRVVKAFTLEPEMKRRMDQSISAVERIQNKMVSVYAGVNSLIDTLGGFAVAGVIFFAGWRCICTALRYSICARGQGSELRSFAAML